MSEFVPPARVAPLDENAITDLVWASCLKIHRTWGPGCLESMYEGMLEMLLIREGLRVERQKKIGVKFEGLVLDEAFRADLIVCGLVIVELKAVEELKKVAFKQTLTYLKLTGLKLGLLVNFGEATMKDGFHRVVNGL